MSNQNMEADDSCKGKDAESHDLTAFCFDHNDQLEVIKKMRGSAQLSDVQIENDRPAGSADSGKTAELPRWFAGSNSKAYELPGEAKVLTLKFRPQFS